MEGSNNSAPVPPKALKRKKDGKDRAGAASAKKKNVPDHEEDVNFAGVGLLTLADATAELECMFGLEPTRNVIARTCRAFQYNEEELRRCLPFRQAVRNLFDTHGESVVPLDNGSYFLACRTFQADKKDGCQAFSISKTLPKDCTSSSTSRAMLCLYCKDVKRKFDYTSKRREKSTDDHAMPSSCCPFSVASPQDQVKRYKSLKAENAQLKSKLKILEEKLGWIDEAVSSGEIIVQLKNDEDEDDNNGSS